ncbi:MAG: DUF3311 domain-containing protein [Actinomycetota bacterium]|nr:DUF3311 domain-containing protein [Actinomycetota bacterium]
MSHASPPAPGGSPARPAARVIVAVMVLAPLIGLLWVPFFAKKKPELFGFPFFYWYQLLWVFITAALTLVAYLIVRRGDIDRADHRQAQRDEGTRS